MRCQNQSIEIFCFLPQNPRMEMRGIMKPPRLMVTSPLHNVSCADRLHTTVVQCSDLSCRNAHICCVGLCYDCRKDRPTTLSSLLSHVRTSEKLLTDAHSVCSTCTRSPTAEPIECISLDCPWFYARYKAEEKVELIAVLNQLIREVESEDPDALAERVLQEELALSEWSDVTEISDDELPSHSPV